ncbi:hypothetical protein E5288_WYG001359 [Bos mutus]|uniref:Uncharacterized protein n=1 Tax=Bos mutus TaxID=72004 RepID=A0A6B0R2Z4_9CETA|nr:hypothetical protein [Bos mutus]
MTLSLLSAQLRRLRCLTRQVFEEQLEKTDLENSKRVGEKSIRYTNSALSQWIDILILSLFTSRFYPMIREKLKLNDNANY